VPVRGDTGFPVRVRFTKRGKVRFVSHRDVARAFERAFRIEALPLAFTQGFSPRPKVSFGLALGVGHESDAEYLDVELSEPIDADALTASVSAALPDGIDVTGATLLEERAPALQESITCVAYRIAPADMAPGDLARAVQSAQSSAALPFVTTRKGREVTDDLRPAIRSLEAADGSAVDACLEVELSTKPRGIRPADLLSVLRDLSGGASAGAQPAAEDRVVRTRQWIERDGERLEPLVADRRRPSPMGESPRAAPAARATSKGTFNVRRDHPGGDRLRTEPEPAGQHGQSAGGTAGTEKLRRIAG
jgi:radical SAM-linked protein